MREHVTLKRRRTSKSEERGNGNSNSERKEDDMMPAISFKMFREWYNCGGFELVP